MARHHDIDENISEAEDLCLTWGHAYNAAKSAIGADTIAKLPPELSLMSLLGDGDARTQIRHIVELEWVVRILCYAKYEPAHCDQLLENLLGGQDHTSEAERRDVAKDMAQVMTIGILHCQATSAAMVENAKA